MGVIRPVLLRICFTAGAFFGLGLVSHSLLADKPRTRVADLRYGVALYHYYQERYMAALTELLVAKERGGIKGHGDNPILWEGGFALAYGMERHSGKIFDALLAQNRSREVQDAAWFYLANLRYLRGDWLGAEDAIRRVSFRPKDQALRYELGALKINLAIKQNRLPQALVHFKSQPLKQGWRPYVYYNLGSAWARQGRFSNALPYFNYFEEGKFDRDEHRALYDKAMTAAGFSLIKLGQPQLAAEKFAQVRLSSQLSRRAMLGYGWAHAEMNDFEAALRPWLHLSEAKLLDENVLEALIAVPYAYEKLGMEGLALLKLQEAEVNFSEEIGMLDELIKGLDGDVMLEALKISRNLDLDWLDYAEENELSPHLVYLIYLFSREKFQGLVQELRDIIGIQEDLLTWRYKLDFYLDMLSERDRDHQRQAEELGLRDLQQDIAEMEVKRTVLAEELKRIDEEQDFLAMATDEEARLLKRLERADKNIALLRDTDPFIDESEDAVRRYRGILLWNTNQSYADRYWRAKKELNQLDEKIGSLRKTLINVNNIMARPHDLNPYRQKIDAAKKKLDQEIISVEVALDLSKLDVQSEIVNVLKQQRQRLHAYMGVCRLSIARLYDKATQEQMRAASAVEAKTAEDNTPKGNESENNQPENNQPENKAPKDKTEDPKASETDNTAQDGEASP